MEVSRGEQCANELGVFFMECSAHEETNISLLLTIIRIRVSQREQKNESSSTLQEDRAKSINTPGTGLNESEAPISGGVVPSLRSLIRSASESTPTSTLLATDDGTVGNSTDAEAALAVAEETAVGTHPLIQPKFSPPSASSVDGERCIASTPLFLSLALPLTQSDSVRVYVCVCVFIFGYEL